MHFVSFIVVLAFILVAAILFSCGIVNLYQGNKKSRSLVSNGFIVGLWGIVVTAIIFGFFNL
jgi:hypothetical protein